MCWVCLGGGVVIDHGALGIAVLVEQFGGFLQPFCSGMLVDQIAEIAGGFEDFFSAGHGLPFKKDRFSEKPLQNKLEIITRQGAGIEWRMTSKIPLFDENDHIVGTAGVSRRPEHGEGPPLPTPQRAISDLVDYIHEHLGDNLTVQDLASEAGMSVSSLERRFHKYLGTTPKRYLVRARMAAACEHLLNTTLSIGQIANSLSYQEHASFTRAFVSVMHVSPREYRELYSHSN